MIGGWALIVLVGFGFWLFFKVCDEFAKSNVNPNKKIAKNITGSIVSGVIAYKATELLSKSRAEKNAERGGRSVVDDINASKRR